MMSEHEYEEWFDKYLGDVESTLKTENTSQISNIPRPFNAKRWAGINVIILILALLGSLLFAGYNSVHPQWYFEWGCNALLNMFFGLLVSLLIFIYTNLRERNITYYTDVIPLLKKRYKNMHDAFFQYHFKLSINFQKMDYDKLYEAWHMQSNTGFVIVNFFQYLVEVTVFEKNPYGVTAEKLEKMSDKILEADRKIQDEYLHSKVISEETYNLCEQTMNIPFELLMILKQYIDDLEKQLFGIKYDKKKLTKEEKEYGDDFKEE